MPNRWLKADILTSDRWNGVSSEAQNLYVRLLMVSDDHGRFDGRATVVESACYPLKTFACNCTQVLAELESVDLIRGYFDAKGKPFLLIPRFYERPRSKSRFPEPPAEVSAEHGCTHLFTDVCKCEHSNTTATSTSTAITTSTTTKSVAQEPAAPALQRRAKPITAETWSAYSIAYSSRYGTEPTRNARVNGQLAQFVGLVPTDEAPAIAAFYVSVNKPYYVSQRHPVGVLVKDAEGLRTQWLTGRVATTLEARSAEQVDAVREQIERVGRRLEGNA